MPTALSHTIATFLDEASLAFARESRDDETTFALAMQGDHTVFDTWIAVYEDAQRVIVVSNHPTPIPDALIPTVAEYLMRVNVGLILGAFDLDYDTGAVRFRTAVDVEGVSDTATLRVIFQNVFYTNIIAADRYFHGLAKVVMSGITPAEAVALLRDAH